MPVGVTDEIFLPRSFDKRLDQICLQKDNLSVFKHGDKVKTKRGEIRRVLYQKENQAFVEEESNTWNHPSDLPIIDSIRRPNQNPFCIQ
jgi:hypothetical protein